MSGKCFFSPLVLHRSVVFRVAKGPAGKDSVEVVTSAIPGHWSLWSEDQEFGASLGYIVNLCSKYKQNTGHGGIHL